jgi:DNA-binding NarL/FixJ family response regulator
VVLDLTLPDVTGVDGLLRLKAATPRTPVVVVSGLTDDRIVAQALRAGAAGFVRKDTPGEALVAAFRQVLDGGVYTPPDFTPPAAADDEDAALDDAVGRLTELTPQQLRILSLVCEGKLNKQIAFDLAIAETTVKAHITAILRKLGVQSRTQAVLIAQKASYAGILKG